MRITPLANYQIYGKNNFVSKRQDYFANFNNIKADEITLQKTNFKGETSSDKDRSSDAIAILFALLLIIGAQRKNETVDILQDYISLNSPSALEIFDDNTELNLDKYEKEVNPREDKTSEIIYYRDEDKTFKKAREALDENGVIRQRTLYSLDNKISEIHNFDENGEFEYKLKFKKYNTENYLFAEFADGGFGISKYDPKSSKESVSVYMVSGSDFGKTKQVVYKEIYKQ